jgi:hypothetical protein
MLSPMRLSSKLLTLVLALIGLISAAPKLRAQGTQTDYGKNVLQYGEFEWYSYQTENFDIYFYTGGKELARFVVLNVEADLKQIEQKIDYPIGERMVFVIYNSYTDFRQSNYLINNDHSSSGGRTQVSENKAFIYFNGDHYDFEAQVRNGIASLIFNEMLVGGSIQEKVQNNILLNLPEWYTGGLANYLSLDWNQQSEDKLRRGINRGKFKNLAA